MPWSTLVAALPAAFASEIRVEIGIEAQLPGGEKVEGQKRNARAGRGNWYRRERSHIGSGERGSRSWRDFEIGLIHGLEMIALQFAAEAGEGFAQAEIRLAEIGSCSR